MLTFGLMYLALIVAMIVADLHYVRWSDLRSSLADEQLQFSLAMSLISCTMSAILAMWVAVPTGYLLARTGPTALRRRFENRPRLRRVAAAGRHMIATLFDVPIIMPPLVVGISLLVLFQTPVGRWFDQQAAAAFELLGFPGIRGITYEFPAIVLAQFTVAAAFAVRIMRTTFEEIDAEPERVALTQGASDGQAFWQVAMPQAWRGMVSAFTLAWARALGEFGPILIFAGTARMKTEVLPTTIYLRFSIGDLRGAIVASLILLTLAAVVLIALRWATLSDSVSREKERAGR